MPSTRQSSNTVAAIVDVADCGLVPATASVPRDENERTRARRPDRVEIKLLG